MEFIVKNNTLMGVNLRKHVWQAYV